MLRDRPLEFVLEELCEQFGELEIIFQLSRVMSRKPRYQRLGRDMDKLRDAIADANETELIRRKTA